MLYLSYNIKFYITKNLNFVTLKINKLMYKVSKVGDRCRG